MRERYCDEPERFVRTRYRSEQDADRLVHNVSISQAINDQRTNVS